MSNFQAINYKDFAGRSWKLTSNFAFSATDSLCAISAGEAAAAALSLPLAFLKERDQFTLVAILGLTSGENLCVGKNGNWLGPYVPALYRHYPFRIGKSDASNLLVCVDTESSLSNDNTGYPYFESEAQVSPELLKVQESLEALNGGFAAAKNIGGLFSELNLLKTLSLSIGDSENPVALDGIYTIDESLLNGLPGESLAELHSAGGMTLAYAHLLSLQNFNNLVNLAAAKADSGSGDTDSFSLAVDDDGGNINLENI